MAAMQEMTKAKAAAQGALARMKALRSAPGGKTKASQARKPAK